MIIIKNATNKNSKINNATKKIAKKAFDRRQNWNNARE